MFFFYQSIIERNQFQEVPRSILNLHRPIIFVEFLKEFSLIVYSYTGVKIYFPLDKMTQNCL